MSTSAGPVYTIFRELRLTHLQFRFLRRLDSVELYEWKERDSQGRLYTARRSSDQSHDRVPVASTGTAPTSPPGKAPSDGQPLWDFLRDKWPYSYSDAAIKDIFEGALTLSRFGPEVQAFRRMCSLETTLQRMGFGRADIGHVRLTFEIAFNTMLALELHRSGHSGLPRSLAHMARSMARVYDVLRTNKVIRRWMDPHPEFYHDLLKLTDQTFSKDVSEIAVLFAKRTSTDENISLESAKKLYLCHIAAQMHSSFVDTAIDAVMQQLWQYASEVRVRTSTRTQWEELRTRCRARAMIRLDRDMLQTVDGFCLPKYQDGMSNTAENLVATAANYAALMYERWFVLQAALGAHRRKIWEDDWPGSVH